MRDPTSRGRMTRRSLLGAGAITAAPPVLAPALASGAALPEAPGPAGAAIPVELSVNGQTRRLSLDPRTTLLDALRDHLGLTGAKKGCDHGQCGALHGAGRRASARWPA